MKWTTILVISYQAMEREKKIVTTSVSWLPGLRKYTEQKKAHHYGSPSGDFEWRGVVHMIQHGACRTTASSFRVRRKVTRTYLQPATHDLLTFSKSGHRVFHQCIELNTEFNIFFQILRYLKRTHAYSLRYCQYASRKNYGALCVVASQGDSCRDRA